MNFTAEQQIALENARMAQTVDLANLNNRQQTSMFKAQASINSILSDQAATNAAKQFNASSENQMTQFYDNLSTQVKQFNTTQANAMSQFNAGEKNAMEKFNAEMQNQRDQFNAQNRLVIDQANAQWRRQIATADTAATTAVMKQFKNLFPFIAAIGVFFLASNSPMWKQMNQKPSVENEIKPIPVEEFK